MPQDLQEGLAQVQSVAKKVTTSKGELFCRDECYAFSFRGWSLFTRFSSSEPRSASCVCEPGDHWRKRLHVFKSHHKVGDAIALAQSLYPLGDLLDAADE